MRALLPVDGSDYTKRVLSYIAAHPELVGGGHEYTVFTAVPPVPSNAARFLDRSTLDGYYRNEAEEVLEPVRKFAEQQGWKLREAHHSGHRFRSRLGRKVSRHSALKAMAEYPKRFVRTLIVLELCPIENRAVLALPDGDDARSHDDRDREPRCPGEHVSPNPDS